MESSKQQQQQQQEVSYLLIDESSLITFVSLSTSDPDYVLSSELVTNQFIRAQANHERETGSAKK